MNLNFKYILFLFSFFLLTTNTNAQHKKTDSLKIVLENHTTNDTTRVNLLIDLIYANFRRDVGATNLYLNEADSISNLLNYDMGKARVNYTKGILENIKSNYAESLHFFKKSLEYYEAIQDKKRIADVYLAFGNTNSSLSQLDEALENFKKASKIYKELNNKRDLATSLINIGNIYSEIGQYKQAIYNYKEALVLSKIINDEDGISYVHANLGVVYKVQGNYPLAIENYNKSLYYTKKTNDTLRMAVIHNNLCDIYTLLKKYDKALSHHKESLSFSKKMNSKKLISVNYSSVGAILSKKKEYIKALEYFNKSLKISQEINALKQTALCLLNIGNINLQLNKPSIAREHFIKAKTIYEETNNKHNLPTTYIGVAETYLKEKQFKKALLNAKKGQQIAKALDMLEPQKTASEILSEVYQNTGQYKKSLESYQEFKTLNDSLFKKENIEKIAQLEYEYKYKQAIDSTSIRELKLTKAVRTTSKDLEKSKRNYLWAIISFLVVSIASVSFIFYEKLRNAKAITQNVIIEQKLLRSQMTPHFIFNSLSVLQGMVLNKEIKKSVNYLSKFSKLLRITLENSRDKTVLLSKELMATENYLALQNLENKSYQYSINIEDSVDASTIEIPPMLIQPFVENAVEHAFKNQTENRKIDIHLSYLNKSLVCKISDNGVGINFKGKSNNKNKNSLATKITSERLKVLSKDFKMKGSVTIENRQKFNEQGTLVTLVIPYKMISK